MVSWGVHHALLLVKSESLTSQLVFPCPTKYPYTIFNYVIWRYALCLNIMDTDAWTKINCANRPQPLLVHLRNAFLYSWTWICYLTHTFICLTIIHLKTLGYVVTPNLPKITRLQVLILHYNKFQICKLTLENVKYLIFFVWSACLVRL